jgi:hypothetical protein
MNCYNNSFASNCSSNKFGIFCYGNKFTDTCSYNEFKNNCQNNSFNGKINYFSLGNNCQNITININKSNAIPVIMESDISSYSIPYTTAITSATKIGKNSSGVTKMYNEADLVG